ncbi:peptidoglycan L-alanyl-D-glutamate endopeptidase [Sporosarcina sp. P37]|uniref:M15 family metallopeptidase n=1 Tax=unclassified Sporosarcina TaxID=2647733 RepID=UPI000A17A7AA|nr:MULTISPECIES: M15 family metallopeptidase [unclassified Sporosarcina]ARK23328.1 peptidoglycan L-alanyl-D-glutamate endopeptidase [Sporosarcina sp. P37]PID19581.1 peptidoglycan L-alanyl-D-glutamate endopeptidase [Sporosarcina sp. P35]
MSVTKASRNISELSSAAQTAIKLLFQEFYKAGITDVFVTETYRSQERQRYLYAQGRTRPGIKVTWTLNSNHASRRAWDIAVAPPKDLYDIATLNKCGAIARKLGINWGGDWAAKNIDRPHFEIKPGWTMPKGYQLEGTVTIPTSSNTRVNLVTNVAGAPSEKEEPKKEGGNRVWIELTSPTLEKEFLAFLESKAHQEIAVNLAVDQGFSEKWKTDKKATPEDKAVLGLLGAVREHNPNRNK